MRRFSDEVHVRSGAVGGVADAPAQFVWRNRLYVVREVLSRWRERSAWWEHSAVAAVHGDLPTGDVRASGAGTGRRVLEIGDLEREVWRVEASAGHGAAVGVYDLARPVAPGTAAVTTSASRSASQVVSEVTGSPDRGGRNSGSPRPDWQLLRVSD